MSSLVKVDTSGLHALAARLGSFSKQCQMIQVRALNRAAERGRTAAKREIVAQVSLKASYVLDRLSIRKATAGDPVAVIATTIRGISLVNYGARQLTRAAKRAKGDALRGIGAGRKQAGVSVAVGVRGRRQMPGAFMVPRRAGKVSGGNDMGVFIRVGAGRKDIKHLYGPSVDQVFRGVIVGISSEVAGVFAAGAARLADLEIRKLTA